MQTRPEANVMTEIYLNDEILVLILIFLFINLSVSGLSNLHNFSSRQFATFLIRLVFCQYCVLIFHAYLANIMILLNFLLINTPRTL